MNAPGHNLSKAIDRRYATAFTPVSRCGSPLDRASRAVIFDQANRCVLGLWQNQSRSSRQVKALALEHIAELELKITEMRDEWLTEHQIGVDSTSIGDGVGDVIGFAKPGCPIPETRMHRGFAIA